MFWPFNMACPHWSVSHHERATAPSCDTEESSVSQQLPVVLQHVCVALTSVGRLSTISVMCAVMGSRRHGCISGHANTSACCTRSIHATTCTSQHRTENMALIEWADAPSRCRLQMIVGYVLTVCWQQRRNRCRWVWRRQCKVQ